ncbi:MAG: PTS sugar transporter subunit IIA [Erysipelotrichia bacterium]|nr:PTS sugar transporter subunit IIA [Erysipelotrichia bacterium]
MKILLGSHGRLASGIKTSLEILIGGTDKLTVLDAYVDDFDIDRQLSDFFSAVAEDEQVLMLSDLYGGSVNQKMYLYLNRKNTFLVAGVNLALVLEVCMRDEIDEHDLEQIVRQAREMQRIVHYDSEPSIDEEDFF